MRKTSYLNCICVSLSLVAIVFLCFTVSLFYLLLESNNDSSENKTTSIPLAINTWSFTNATSAAWEALFTKNLSAVDAVELGCTVCEQEQCDFTVGYGGSPDENGETTLDAFIMDGVTMNVGAVGALRNIKSAISVARYVMENTGHSILAGELATQFAVEMGFQKENLTTNHSTALYQDWVAASCQPNYWLNVYPDPTQQCGPYSPVATTTTSYGVAQKYSHDTISMITLDRKGQIAVGTSSNGATHKIPGRVGDAPIVGAGGYADGTVGAAACTGDGDVMMRFLPSFLAVEEMRRGSSPKEAADTAISRIKEYYPSFSGAIITANVQGEYAASCHGLSYFPYSVHSVDFPAGAVVHVECI